MPQVHSVVKRAPNNTALIIEIEAPKVLATVEAWEAAACLDTTTLDLATKGGKIWSAGETKTTEEMERRLIELRNVICNYGGSHAA